MTTLVFLLGDQLTPSIPSLRGCDPSNTVVLLAEVAEETRYVAHHKAKIVFILSAMRHFAAELEGLGWRVDYVRLDDPDNTGCLTGELRRAVDRHGVSAVRATKAGEWRVLSAMEQWADDLGVPVDLLEDDRFICTAAAFNAWAAGRKQLRMEYFYREMRRRTGLLMRDDGTPEGGQWNYDSENRKPPSGELFGPARLGFPPDPTTREVIQLVSKKFPRNIGKLDKFQFAVRREDARLAFSHFLDHGLPGFGDYQDAMLSGAPFLYHSLISAYMNVGLLDPLQVCREAEACYRLSKAPLNAVEGFIRQIIGWREYVRGIYWREMPGYTERNALDARRRLPTFYWTGKTEMRCLAEAIGQTIDHAYAHHIQRLMVTGNFALLIGADPKAVHDWYLSVYVDAFEWVELPNTLGMSQFADGGLLGSKPYAASGAYIDRMSDYCAGCAYDVRQKTGDKACPFNALYWDFLIRNRAALGANQRLTMVYASWDRMTTSTQQAYRDSAAAFLAALS
jgi:deoxyribodipyrimidine photolyase-related protein